MTFPYGFVPLDPEGIAVALVASAFLGFVVGAVLVAITAVARR